MSSDASIVRVLTDEEYEAWQRDGSRLQDTNTHTVRAGTAAALIDELERRGVTEVDLRQAADDPDVLDQLARVIRPPLNQSRPRVDPRQLRLALAPVG